jgi:hypothetical protein
MYATTQCIVLTFTTYASKNQDLINAPISNPNIPSIACTKFESIAFASTPEFDIPPLALTIFFTNPDAHHPNHAATQTYPKILVQTLPLTPRRPAIHMTMSSKVMMNACERKNGIEKKDREAVDVEEESMISPPVCMSPDKKKAI